MNSLDINKGRNGNLLVNYIAENLAEEAKKNSMDRKYKSPFEISFINEMKKDDKYFKRKFEMKNFGKEYNKIKHEGYCMKNFGHKGGKKDDITVLVANVKDALEFKDNLEENGYLKDFNYDFIGKNKVKFDEENLRLLDDIDKNILKLKVNGKEFFLIISYYFFNFF